MHYTRMWNSFSGIYFHIFQIDINRSQGSFQGSNFRVSNHFRSMVFLALVYTNSSSYLIAQTENCFVELNLCIDVTGEDSLPFYLLEGISNGGRYSVPPIQNNIFDSALANERAHSITFTSTCVLQGCTNSSSYNITMDPDQTLYWDFKFIGSQDYLLYPAILIGNQCLATNYNYGLMITKTHFKLIGGI